MRKSLGTLAMLAVILVCVGLSRDWFTIERERDGAETDVHVTIHRDRIRSDTHGAAEMAKEIGDNIEVRFADGDKKEKDEEPVVEEPPAEEKRGLFSRFRRDE